MRYCTYKNNRNDLTFIHFYANNSIQCYWLQASKLNKSLERIFLGGWGGGQGDNLKLTTKVWTCHKHISVWGGGAGGAAAPPVGKNSIIRAKLMYCSGKDTVKNILLFNILIYLSSSRIPQNGLHDILPVLYKVTSILVSK